MSRMRKSKLVTVCSVDSSRDDGSGAYSSNTIKSRSSKSSWYIKVPINDHNIALYEVYGDSHSKESSPCQKVNFLTLCCKSDVDVNSIRLSYDEYQHVKYVEFTGHIGSMKVAFELLHKFPNVKELIFILNDNNIKCENDEYRSYKNEDGFVTKALTVEKLAIVQDFSVCEKSSKEAQEDGKVWRIDEILYLSRLCIPKIKKFETVLIGNGSNYEKVRGFIDCMPFLKKNHSAEISNGYLKVRLTVSSSTSSRTTPAIHARVAPLPAVLNATVTSNALVPIQSVIKLEKMDEEVAVTLDTNACNLNRYSLQYSTRQEQNGTYVHYPQSLVPYNVERTVMKHTTCNLPYVHPVPVTPPSANNVHNKQTPQKAGLPYFVCYPPSAFVSNGMMPQVTESSHIGNNVESTQQPNRQPASARNTVERQDNSFNSTRRTDFNSNLDDDSRLETARNPSPPPRSVPPPPLLSTRQTNQTTVGNATGQVPNIDDQPQPRSSLNSGGKSHDEIANGNSYSSSDTDSSDRKYPRDPRSGRKRKKYSRRRRSSSSSSYSSRTSSPSRKYRGHRNSYAEAYSHHRSRSHRNSRTDHYKRNSRWSDGNEQEHPNYTESGPNHCEYYHKRGYNSNFRSRGRGRGRSRFRGNGRGRGRGSLPKHE